MWALEFEVKSYGFQIVGSSKVSFTIDVTPLDVTVLPIMNKILSESGAADVALNFTVNGSASKISYALDGQNNVTIVGNTTLTGMPVGLHNVTVYVWDDAGNIGASETVTFAVAEPETFPTVLIAVILAVSMSTIVAGSLLYFKKQKNRKD